MIKDVLKYAATNLWHRKTRSFLSVLSILIGITAIFALASFGLGIDAFVKDYAKQAGADKIVMMPKDSLTSSPGNSNSAFTESELDFIRKTKGVDEAAGMIIANAKVKFKDYKEIYTFGMGMPTNPKEMQLVGETFNIIDIEKGRNLKQGDMMKVVLGYNYLFPNKLFKKAISVGDNVKINNIGVQVIGFFKEIGNPQDDAQLYLSIEGAKSIFKKENYEYLLLRSASGENPSDIAAKIKEKFRKHRGQKKGEEDFFVQTFDEMIATYSIVINIIVGVLVLIALVSVIVAAVNIMNTMYTSILERTREIGVMKSIGAKNSFISIVFMAEAGILGLVGGTAGILLGYIFAKTGGAIANFYDLSLLKPLFPNWLIIGCLLFSFLVGAVSGLLPAIQASKLKPVDALRYE